MGDEFKQYRKSHVLEMRDYVPGEDLTHIYVSEAYTPELGGMVARNPNNHAHQWYVTKKFFDDNYERVKA